MGAGDSSSGPPRKRKRNRRNRRRESEAPHHHTNGGYRPHKGSYHPAASQQTNDMDRPHHGYQVAPQQTPRNDYPYQEWRSAVPQTTPPQNYYTPPAPQNQDQVFHQLPHG